MQARASDWGFCWRILCRPEQVNELSAGEYCASQRNGLRILLEDIVQPRASYWGFCWRIFCKQEQVTEVFAVAYIVQAAEVDWHLCWRILRKPKQVTKVSVGVYCASLSKWLRFLLEDIVQARPVYQLLLMIHWLISQDWPSIYSM